MRKFIFSPDKHVGWQAKNGELTPLHDAKAIKAMMKFAQDFKPDVWIEGGDNIDCGPVSHWLKHKKRSIANLDLRKDCKEYTKLVLEPISRIGSISEKYWLIGNHEDWLEEFGEENPGMASIVDPRNLLDLEDWDVIESGGNVQLGHLNFVHGDKIGNVKNVADRAIQLYGRCVAFGHFHTNQVHPKHEIIDVEAPKIALCVPGLCNKNPGYMENRPNQWMKGFAYGYVFDDGNFNIYTAVIVDGRFAAEGKVYRG